MKKNRYNVILILLALVLCSNSCERKEYQRFIIQNNSDKEIIISTARFSIAQDTTCLWDRETMITAEYRDLIQQRMIRPHSYRNFERIGQSMQNFPTEVRYIGVFYRVDIDTMSCEEFAQKYPIRKEWRVTRAYMEANDWTLVYTPAANF